MAFFGVTIETIEKVYEHPNADKLSLAKAKGLNFQFVILKDSFKEGDQVLYFPIDAQLPQALIEKLGMVGRFSGENKNIVKTLVLREQISQGYVAALKDVLSQEHWSKTPAEITEHLGVIKYEVETVELNDVSLIGLPSGLSDYDIEGADRNQDIIDLLMDQEVVVSEKMEGDNNSTACDQNKMVYVNTRNRSLVEKKGIESRYWKAARSHKFIEVIQKCDIETAIYYEICGLGFHGNVYGLKEDQCFIFDVKQNGNWLNKTEFDLFLANMNLTHLQAPILFVGKLRDFLGNKTIKEASTGLSKVNPKTLREGIVIKPVVEQRHGKLGRLIIKQRSPEYLAKNKNN
jgi:RNA ligase (TIGR02306 family)